MNEWTHVKGIVLAHFAHELPANPSTDLGPSVLIEPPEPLHRLDDPLALALLREDVPESSIVRSPPKRKIEEEKELARRARQGVEERELEREEAEVDDVDVRFWVRRVEKRRDDVVSRRDAEYCVDGRRDTCQRARRYQIQTMMRTFARRRLAPHDVVPRRVIGLW